MVLKPNVILNEVKDLLHIKYETRSFSRVRTLPHTAPVLFRGDDIRWLANVISRRWAYCALR